MGNSPMIVGMFMASQMLIFSVGEVFLLYFLNGVHPQTLTVFLAIMLIVGIFLSLMISTFTISPYRETSPSLNLNMTDGNRAYDQMMPWYFHSDDCYFKDPKAAAGQDQVPGKDLEVRDDPEVLDGPGLRDGPGLQGNQEASPDQSLVLQLSRNPHLILMVTQQIHNLSLAAATYYHADILQHCTCSVIIQCCLPFVAYCSYLARVTRHLKFI